jgi:hypothetical protein
LTAKHVIAHLDEEKAEGVENEAVEQARILWANAWSTQSTFTDTALLGMRRSLSLTRSF